VHTFSYTSGFCVILEENDMSWTRSVPVLSISFEIIMKTMLMFEIRYGYSLETKVFLHKIFT
jgi:hypothetical protein